MKTNISVTALAIILLILFQPFTIMSANGTEQQQYTVILEEKDFEIRFYPSATVATINSNAKTYRDLSGPGFRKLAGYIFGGNETNTSISMTAPVHMDINDTGSSMSFVMPGILDTIPHTSYLAGGTRLLFLSFGKPDKGKIKIKNHIIH